MEITGYVCAILIGISLELLGSGGSILTVPILVYLLHVDPLDATGYSLFVVGITSTIGCATYIKKQLVDVKTAVLFAIPSITCVFLTRQFFLPAIPDPVFSSASFVLTKELLIMILFASFMMASAYNMIRKAHYEEPEVKEIQDVNYLWLFSLGFVSGILTGLLGVGGGFIIVPALVLFAKVPIRMSVGTSLLIIAFNSISGFAGELIGNHEIIDYRLLFLFTLLSVAGIFIGLRLSLKLNQVQLKKIFGWFVLVMGIFILVKEVYFV